MILGQIRAAKIWKRIDNLEHGQWKTENRKMLTDGHTRHTI